MSAEILPIAGRFKKKPPGEKLHVRNAIAYASFLRSSIAAHTSGDKGYLRVCSIRALLAMKGYAVELRQKRKDAYDIHYCIRNCPGGAGALAEDCRKLLEHESARTGYEFINAKFETVESYGPSSVRLFVEESAVSSARTVPPSVRRSSRKVNAATTDLRN